MVKYTKTKSKKKIQQYIEIALIQGFYEDPQEYLAYEYFCKWYQKGSSRIQTFITVWREKTLIGWGIYLSPPVVGAEYPDMWRYVHPDFRNQGIGYTLKQKLS